MRKIKEMSRLLKIQIKVNKQMFFDTFNENLERNPKEIWSLINAKSYDPSASTTGMKAPLG